MSIHTFHVQGMLVSDDMAYRPQASACGYPRNLDQSRPVTLLHLQRNSIPVRSSINAKPYTLAIYLEHVVLWLQKMVASKDHGTILKPCHEYGGVVTVLPHLRLLAGGGGHPLNWDVPDKGSHAYTSSIPHQNLARSQNAPSPHGAGTRHILIQPPQGKPGSIIKSRDNEPCTIILNLVIDEF